MTGGAKTKELGKTVSNCTRLLKGLLITSAPRAASRMPSGTNCNVSVRLTARVERKRRTESHRMLYLIVTWSALKSFLVFGAGMNTATIALRRMPQTPMRCGGS